MLQGTFRKFLVAILLLMYVGQGFAAASMTCQHMASNVALFKAPAKSSACSAHAKHLTNDTVKSTHPSDCCSHCDCFLGGCSSIALPAALQIVAPLRSSMLVDGYVDSSSSQVALALFRPPIFR
jgi:hypothetical protein